MNGGERRSAPRLRLYLPVRLHQPGAAVVETLGKDISLGGVRCVSPTLIPVGREVTVEVRLPTASEHLRLRGRTAWFQVLPDSEQVDVGITFLDIPDKTQRLMSTCFDRLAVLASK